MIEAYFEQTERVLREFTNIRSYTLTRRVYNRQQGYIGGTLSFEASCRLEARCFVGDCAVDASSFHRGVKSHGPQR